MHISDWSSDVGSSDLPQEDRDPRLYPGGPRGSYRAARQRLAADGSSVGTEDFPARGLGPYRGGGQPARSGQISILDRRQSGRDARRFYRGRDRTQGQLVAAMDRLERAAGGLQNTCPRRNQPRKSQATDKRGRQ